MNVTRLIEILQEVEDKDRIVFVARDEEGNGYREGNVSIDEIMCDQDGEWVSVHPDDLANGEYEGWEDDMAQAVVFW